MPKSAYVYYRMTFCFAMCRNGCCVVKSQFAITNISHAHISRTTIVTHIKLLNVFVENMRRTRFRLSLISLPHSIFKERIDCIITLFTYTFLNSSTMQLLWDSQRGRWRTPPECVQRLLAVLRRWCGNDRAFNLKALTSNGACRRQDLH